MNDYLAKAYAFDGKVRLYAARSTQLVSEAQKIHGLWPSSSAALGRLLTGSVIMGAMYQDDHELTIRIESDGPIEGMVVTTDAHGHVRGYVGNPKLSFQNNDGKINVSHAVGSGRMHVTKDLKVRDIFTSTATLQTGEIAEDMAYYFTASEQIPSAVGLGVKVNTDSSIVNAGGFILQRMPGCPDETIELIEARLNKMKSTTTMLDEGYTPEAMIQEITQGDHQLLHTMPIAYQCDCNREKFERGLLSLGSGQLKTIKEEDGEIETVCHFCRTAYHFDEAAIERLIEEADNQNK